MARRVVCIARVRGAGGDDVSRRVADELGFRLVDDEILQLAAANEGVSIEELAGAERRSAMGEGDVSIDQLQAYIRESIDEAADHGDLVIVSHAASFALAGRDDVLRVLVTASPETRASRIAEDEGLLETDATPLVVTDDDGRRNYLTRCYGIVWESPQHYDLVLNTDALSVDLIVDLIVRATRA
jgi:cytidylate kinase